MIQSENRWSNTGKVEANKQHFEQSNYNGCTFINGYDGKYLLGVVIIGFIIMIACTQPALLKEIVLVFTEILPKLITK